MGNSPCFCLEWDTDPCAPAAQQVASINSPRTANCVSGLRLRTSGAGLVGIFAVVYTSCLSIDVLRLGTAPRLAYKMANLPRHQRGPRSEEGQEVVVFKPGMTLRARNFVGQTLSLAGSV